MGLQCLQALEPVLLKSLRPLELRLASIAHDLLPAMKVTRPTACCAPRGLHGFSIYFLKLCLSHLACGAAGMEAVAAALTVAKLNLCVPQTCMLSFLSRRAEGGLAELRARPGSTSADCLNSSPCSTCSKTLTHPARWQGLRNFSLASVPFFGAILGAWNQGH